MKSTSINALISKCAMVSLEVRRQVLAAKYTFRVLENGGNALRFRLFELGAICLQWKFRKCNQTLLGEGSYTTVTGKMKCMLKNGFLEVELHCVVFRFKFHKVNRNIQKLVADGGFYQATGGESFGIYVSRVAFKY